MMDLVDRVAYKRWCEYCTRVQLDAIDWPTWRNAYNAGLLR